MIPARVPALDPAARRALADTDAVVLTGLPNSPASLPVAAARLFGTSLRELFPHRTRTSVDGGVVGLHADSFDVVVDVGGRQVRRRHPDEDHVLISLAAAAPEGGLSFVLDAHEFTDSLDAELMDFLTGTDVDLYGRWAQTRGLPAAPRVARHVEYTRTGRRITRRSDGATALHRDPAADRVEALLARFDTEVGRVQRTLPRFGLEEGDVLVLDNYRCWHGRDAHVGSRTVHVQTIRTDEA
ncbi:TauD/TfdA family dioxygenase [Lentzea sp. NPDC060358]|uniref:TauD/TfdA family dioxygenase n=1 Tax=Lentzea sp. NPDC060358 TaxID=3347103 RepID=UPI00366805EC